MDSILIENLLKVGLAIAVGGIIGAEREYRDKAAGFRTIILITVGSALFTIFRRLWIQALPALALPRISSPVLAFWERARSYANTAGFLD